VLSIFKIKIAHHVDILELAFENVRLLSLNPFEWQLLTTEKTTGARRQRGERPLVPAVADTSNISLVYRKMASG